MACPMQMVAAPPPGEDNMEGLLRAVTDLEDEGYLDEFLRNHPQHAAGLCSARTMLAQRSWESPGNSLALSRTGQSFTGSPATIPSAQSVRYFVSHVAQLLEDQCPMRSDPNVLSCEDRCLAALQIAIKECLKIVRQNKSCNRPFAGNHIACPRPKPAICPRPLPGATLGQQLNSIPEPMPCPECPKCPTRSCGLSRDANSDPRYDQSYFHPPVAGSFSDGLGGHKIKDFPPPPNNGDKYDGIGGGKIKGIDE